MLTNTGDPVIQLPERQLPQSRFTGQRFSSDPMGIFRESDSLTTLRFPLPVWPNTRIQPHQIPIWGRIQVIRDYVSYSRDLAALWGHQEPFHRFSRKLGF